jgi:hypothetical protein
MAWVSDTVVALDLRRDRYLTLGPAASHAVRAVLAAEPDPADVARDALEPVLRAGLLAPAGRSPAPLHLPQPREPGGVLSRSATPPQDRAGPAGGAIGVIRARRLIVGCDRLARNRGLAVLLARLRAAASEAQGADQNRADRGRADQNRVERDRVERDRVERLAASHDRAWLLVGAPRRSEVAAAALALDAWRSGLAVRVRLGVQKYPFHARMWVEYAGDPIAAPADLAQRLAPLVTIGASR